MKCFKGQGTAEASRRGRTILDPSRPVKATISPADPCVNILSQWEERVDLSPAFLALLAFRSQASKNTNQPSRHRHPKPTFFNEMDQMVSVSDRYTVRLVFRNEEADHIRIG